MERDRDKIEDLISTLVFPSLEKCPTNVKSLLSVYF